MGSCTLGNTYRDKVTGFTGIATGQARYLVGNAQIYLEPSCAANGTPVEGRWIADDRLEPVAEHKPETPRIG